MVRIDNVGTTRVAIDQPARISGVDQYPRAGKRGISRLACEDRLRVVGSSVTISRPESIRGRYC